MQSALPLAQTKVRPDSTFAHNLRPDDVIDIDGHVGIVVDRVAVTWHRDGLTVAIEGHTARGERLTFTPAHSRPIVMTGVA